MAQCVKCGRQLPGLGFGKRICQWCKQYEAAQRGEDTEYQRIETAPWSRPQSSSMIVTQVIFGANVAVFIGMVLAIGGTMLSDPSGQALVAWGANFGPQTVGGQWWRLLTCLFVHGGLLHIAANMYWLWVFGRQAESLYGHWTFAAIYLLSGLGGSVASIYWNPVVLSVGASGAVFGIAGALIASFYLGEFSLPRSAVSGMLQNLVAFAVIILVFGAVSAHTDNAAHVGGLAMGLLLGALIAKVAPAHDAVVQRIGVLLVGAALVAGGGLWLARSHAYLVHRENGLARLYAGDPDSAIKELQKSVKQRPGFAPAHEALAQAYLDKHDYESAAAELKRGLTFDPRNENLYYDLGRVYMSAKQPVKAEEAFRQLLKINPNSADGHAGLGSTLAYEQNTGEALAEFKRAADIDSLYPGVYFKIGILEAQLNQVDNAIAALLKQRQVLDAPENESLLAKLYDAKGMKTDADAARGKAEALSEKN